MKSYDEALEIYPNDEIGWYSRGIALYSLGRIEEAIISFDKVLKLNPNNFSGTILLMILKF